MLGGVLGLAVGACGGGGGGTPVASGTGTIQHATNRTGHATTTNGGETRTTTGGDGGNGQPEANVQVSLGPQFFCKHPPCQTGPLQSVEFGAAKLGTTLSRRLSIPDTA